MIRLFLILYLVLISALVNGQSLRSSYPEMVEQIIKSLNPDKSEQVLIRYDAHLMSALAIQLGSELQKKGNQVEIWNYGPVDNFEELLDKTDIYIWMPVRRSVSQPPSQVEALIEWLDAGKGRQIHFHWGDGTRNWDSTHGEHSAVYDSVYLSALRIDYGELSKTQNRAAEILRSGPVSVTTPAGTNLSFEIGDRTVTKQDGDASKERMKSAQVRIEREIELPAGAIRVAPLEETVTGTLVIGTGTIAGVKVEDLSLIFDKGKIITVEAAKGKSAFEKKLEGLEALNSFREIGIGFNPNLQFPEGYSYVPYYGYGSGVVRLSLGNNIEVGGKVEGNGVQWMFFLDATVKAGDQVIVEEGKIVLD